VCGNPCQAATPFLVLAAALCLAALAGIVAVRWLARSSLLNEPDRFVTLLALGLPAWVIPPPYFATGSDPSGAPKDI
jgi:hypothetical protein